MLIDSHCHLDRLDLAHAHVHRQSAVVVEDDVGLAGAAGRGQAQDLAGGRGQAVHPGPGVVGSCFNGVHGRILALRTDGLRCTKKQI